MHHAEEPIAEGPDRAGVDALITNIWTALEHIAEAIDQSEPPDHHGSEA